MPKFIVKVGDETHEVDRDSIQVPDGHVLMTQEQFDTTLNSKYAKAKGEREEIEKEVRSGLASDDGFFKSLAEKRGIQLDDNLKPTAQLDPEKVRQMHEGWKAEHLAPIVQERDALKEQVQKIRRDSLIASITATAAKLNPNKGVLENPFGDGPSAFVRDIADTAEYDEDSGRFYWKDPKTGAPILKDDGTYAGPDRVLERIRKQDIDHVYFRDVRPDASGYNNPGQGGGKTVTRAQFDAMDQAQRAEFSTAGGRVSD